MNARSLAAGLALAVATIHPAAADHWMQTADPQVIQALNELSQVYGSYCQQGNPQACQMVSSIQAHAGQMLNAGYDCQVRRNQQACAWYQQYYQQLSQTYASTQQAMAQAQLTPPATGVNPMGATHEQRMQNIQQWGQDRLQWGQQSSAALDRSHAEFMQRLRN